MKFFFYTIPVWVVLAIAIVIVGGVGMLGGGIAGWIMTHIVIISVILWALIVLVAMWMAEKGTRIEWLSLVTLLIPPYIMALAMLSDLVAHADDLLTLGILTVLTPFGIAISLIPSLLAGLLNHGIPWRWLGILLNLLVAVAYTVLVCQAAGYVTFW